MTVLHQGDKSRRTIGLISTGQWFPQLGLSVLSGVADVARESAINFIGFQGQNVTSPEARVYEMVNPATIDGLVIWASSFANALGKEQTIKFCQRYHPLPLVSIGMPLPGIPSVLVNSYQATSELIEHLIKVHGCKKIAFLRGPQGHYDSEERYRAYLNTLSHFQLPFSPELVSAYGSWEPNRIAGDLGVWLDEKKVQLDAIVAPSDRLAVAAVLELQRRQIQVPETIAVVGVNDEPCGKAIYPPLTTTTTRLYDRARQATNLLLDLIEGQPAPAQIYAPHELIIRRSCGCPAPAVLISPVIPSAPAIPLNGNTVLPHPFSIKELLQGIMPVGGELTHQLESLLDCFLHDLEQAAPCFFTAKLEQLLIPAKTPEEIGAWEKIATQLRELINPLLDPTRLHRAENLWFQSKVIFSEIKERLILKQRFTAIDRNWEIYHHTRQLISTFELPQLIPVIQQCLLESGFATFYLSLYEKWAQSHPDPNRARLILANTPKGPIDLTNRETVFHLPDLAPAGFPETETAYSLLVLPLYFESHHLGFLLVDRIPFFTRGFAFTALQAQISSALWGAMLFTKQAQAQKMLTRQAHALTRSNNELQKFAYMSSHDLQEPLRKITVFGGRLQGNASYCTAQQLEFLQQIQTAAARMQNLISALLEFSQGSLKNQHPFEKTDLSQIAAEVIEDLEIKITQSRARIELGPLPTLQAAPLQMRQLFQNLISNGIKFGRENIPPRIRIFATQDTEGVLIHFADNGIGIEAENHQRIFTMFEQIQQNGKSVRSGMGLAFCKNVVERHGGTIRVESFPGAGSTFTVKLPFQPPEPGSPSPDTNRTSDKERLT